MNTRALSFLSCVAGDALTRHLSKILTALLTSLASKRDSLDEPQVSRHVFFRDGKEPLLLGFGSVWGSNKSNVRFGSSSSQVQKIWVRFRLGSYILSFEFGSVLYEFGCLTVLNLTVPQ